ncbi:MAG TPA: hypothetical protein VFZ53_23440 [Polyangiaceae bacterium]
MYRQFELTTEDGATLVCWIEDEPRLKVGAWLTLKEIPGVRWRIEKAYNFKALHHQTRRWKVGGLS